MTLVRERNVSVNLVNTSVSAATLLSDLASVDGALPPLATRPLSGCVREKKDAMPMCIL